jgi:hypothetical protein
MRTTLIAAAALGASLGAGQALANGSVAELGTETAGDGFTPGQDFSLLVLDRRQDRKHRSGDAN